MHRGTFAPRNLLTGLALLAAIALPPAKVGAVEIGALHCNTSSGVPASPYSIGTPVTISGTVTAGTGIYTSTYTDIWVQDPTGGIEIYSTSIPATFQLGDSVTIQGTIDQYRGNTEVVLGTWQIHLSGLPVPEPMVLTCDEVTHTWQPDYCEPNESRLVRINGVTYSGTWPSDQGTVTLTDATGSCTMFIDRDTGVQNVPPPGGSFDVIGILKQFAGFSPPYDSGYEILPRFPEDIIVHPGPQIVQGPVETDLRADQVTIIWTTDTPADSRVDFGLTDQYEIGSVIDPAPVTEHAILLPGLDPATIHHYRVASSNENGTTQSGDRLFSSGSSPESTGEIRVYFNKSVDTSLALGVEAHGDVNLLEPLTERINAAAHSIDICMYSFDVPAVTDALLAAKDRGVLLRFVYENRTNYQAEVQRLIQNGVTVIDDGFGPGNDGSGLMHNKFWVFDHRGGSPDGSDDWVWTGSLNLTSQGTFTDAQNVILIQDEALAETYTREFEEMWGSSTQVPNPDASRFGANKLNDTPKRFDIAGVPVEVHFSPSDDVIQQAILQVMEADRSIHFGILAFTRDDLALEMRGKWYGVPGFEVRGVFDSSEGGNPYSEYADMRGAGDDPWSPPADVWLDQETGTLHHKYMILDANLPGLAPAVITGSPNWSNSADYENDENMLIVHDFEVANQYYQEFARRYTAAGGSGYLASGVGPGDGAAGGSWTVGVAPNPASRYLSIRYHAPSDAGGRISLFGVDGRREAVLFQGDFPAGTHRLDIDLSRIRLRGGVHFVRLEAGSGRADARFLLLR